MTAARRVPLITEPIDTTVRPPGSKSETIRALAAAALADGRSHLYRPLQADDPAAMAGALQRLGADVGTAGEPWAVDGRGGRLSAADGPLDANESGLSARILLAMAGSLDGSSRVIGRGRLPERPMRGVVDVLRAQGVEVSGELLPIVVEGRGSLRGGRIEVDCSESSQFATAIMLLAPIMHEPAVIELTGLTGSGGYLDMTESIMRRFGAEIARTVTGFEIANDGYVASDVEIEPDASAAVYPMGLAAVTGGRVVIEGLGEQSRQPDLRVASILESMGCEVDWDEDRLTVVAPSGRLGGVDVDMSDAPDGALGVAVVCMFADGPSRIAGLGSLRHKESDRLETLREGIARIGGDVEIEKETLLIRPRPLHGAEIDSHGDHRIAMAMAIAGVNLEDFSVRNPDAVRKTWPGFWDWMDDLATT